MDLGHPGLALAFGLKTGPNARNAPKHAQNGREQALEAFKQSQNAPEQASEAQ